MNENRLVEYLFVDRPRLDSYFDQIVQPLLSRRPAKETEKWSISIKGPKYEHSVESSSFSTHDKTEALKELLIAGGNLGTRRPPQIPDRGAGRPPQFVLERIQARKVILPQTLVASVPPVREFAIWISDPDPSDFTAVDWDFAGTFLYLTEVFIDEAAFGTTYSGCSALQAIFNSATGKPFLDRNFDESYGRRSALHPAEKLARLGAQVGDLRSLETLYRTRYLTNEQCYTVAGVERRVHDLLGYPVYIAEA